MNSGLPTALILGIDCFGANKLAEELSKKDIMIIGVGEFVIGLNEIKNYEWVNDLDSVQGHFNYVFDFEGDKKDWEKIDGEKYILISINDLNRSNFLKEEVKNWEVDWRIVDSFGVYGVGVGEDDFLAKIIKQAVQNKNLELPDKDKTIRLLAMMDWVEAVLRASFLSGTEKEMFLILGKEISFEQLARILMDKAKMTRFKVMEKELEIYQGEEKKARESEKKIRWEAKIDFQDGIEETLQYFFSKTDEENRHPTKTHLGSCLVGQEKKEEKKKRIFDVVVEEQESQLVWPKEKENVEKGKQEMELKMIDYSNQEVELNSNTQETSIPKKIEVKNNTEEEKLMIEDEYIEEESEDFLDIPKFNLKTLRQDQDEPFRKVPLINSEQDLDENFKNDKKGIDKKNNKEHKIKTNKWWWLILVSIIIMSLMEPTKWVVNTVKALNNVRRIPELIFDKRYAQVDKLTKKSLKDLNEIDQKISDWNFNRFKTMRNYQTGLKVVSDFLTLENKVIDLAKGSELMSQAMFLDGEVDWNRELEEMKNDLNQVESDIGVLQARLNGDYSWIPSKWKMTVQKQMKNIEEIRSQVGLAKNSIGILPDFLGLDGKERKYMVLLQNESELRPTGGFIGSYGILKFNKGKLVSFEIKDVYEADGQLKGHVEPPWEIKNYLKEANWYMRDANWKADFGKTSVDIQWFLDKETGEKIDGVIGINLAVAKSILTATGEIYIPDFKETINSDNLYEQAEFYAETKFFPGSVQKASFLGAVGKQLFEEIKSLNMEKRMLLVSALFDLLEKNEIQISINNKETATTLNNLGWDGKIYNGKCGVENCITDYFYVVEANLGVNKANYFLNRSMEQAVEIKVNSVERILKINYENTAKNSSWPGGDYKNYIRIYLPGDVNLVSISVADGDNTATKKIYVNDELRINDVNGKKEVGFLMTVPILKKRIVEIKYISKIDLSNKTKFSYVNYIQRQSGSGETGLVNLITFPSDWQPNQVQPAASLVGGKLLFNQKLDRDIKMGVELER